MCTHMQMAHPPATMGNGVYVRRSTLGAKSGLGLFATRAFDKNEVITEYDGQLFNYQDACSMPRSHIRSVSFGWTAIDGLKEFVAGR